MADGLGVFRTVSRGDVELEVNSKRMNQDRFIDQSRLQSRYTEDYVPSDTPGKPGRFVGRTEVASVTDNARAGCDAMKHRASFKDESASSAGDDCCAPYPSFVCGYGNGPLTRKRGDD